MKKIIWIVLIAVAGCSSDHNGVLLVTGQIEGISVDAGSRVGGRVSEVLVSEGDAVPQGAVLVRLESFDADAVVAGAKAQLAQADAVVAKLEAGARPEQIKQAEAVLAQTRAQYDLLVEGARSQEIQAADAAVDAAKAQLDQASVDFKRIGRLHKEGAVTDTIFDQARHQLEVAQANHKAATEKFNLVVEGARAEEIRIAKAAIDRAEAVLEELRNGARKEDIAAARAVRDAAAADLQRARVAADEMVVKSPRDGIVEALDVYPGDLVKPGPIVRIVDPDDLELVVYVSAAMLGFLQVHQTIELTTDSHGEERFEGTIKQIASVGEYTPRNLQTEEDRVQQVFGITLQLDSSGGKLKAGMTATAHVDAKGKVR